jgi:hypothetical protein
VSSLFNKSTPSTTTTTQNTTIPSWLTNAAQGNISYANGIPQYTPYSGQPISGLTPAQLQAITTAINGAGAYTPALNGAITGANGAVNFTAPQLTTGGINANTSALMSPFTQGVVDTTNAEINRQRGLELNNNASAAATAHAFGTDSQANNDANTNRNFDQILAQTDAGLYNTGFNNAQGAAINMGNTNLQSILAGAGINLEGSGLLGNLAGLGTNITGATTNNLLNAGGVAQNTATQQGLFTAQQYQDAYNSLFQKLQGQTQAIGSAPHDTSQTGTQTTPYYYSPLGQIAGIGLGIAGLGLGGPIGAGLGALPGLLGLGGNGAATSASQMGPMFQGPVYNP